MPVEEIINYFNQSTWLEKLCGFVWPNKEVYIYIKKKQITLYILSLLDI